MVSSIPRLIVSICRPASSPIRRRRAADRLWCLVPSRSLLLVHPESRAKTRCVDDRQSAGNLWVSDGRLFSAPKPLHAGLVCLNGDDMDRAMQLDLFAAVLDNVETDGELINICLEATMLEDDSIEVDRIDVPAEGVALL